MGEENRGLKVMVSSSEMELVVGTDPADLRLTLGIGPRTVDDLIDGELVDIGLTTPRIRGGYTCIRAGELTDADVYLVDVYGVSIHSTCKRVHFYLFRRKKNSIT